MSPLYLLDLMFLSIGQLRLWFFIGSLDELIALNFPKGDKVSSKILQVNLVIAKIHRRERITLKTN